jgi:histidine ammonia-lyase
LGGARQRASGSGSGRDERASAAADAVRQLGALVPVYGRTTGVGANREVSVSDQVGHGRRLLRSHAGGAGPPLDVAEARAT